MIKMKKRSISAIVAMVLIILITVAGIAIIWVAIVPMIDVDLGVDEDVRLNIVSSEGYTVWDKNVGLVSVQVERKGDGEVCGLELIFILDGNSVKHFFEAIPKVNGKRVYNVNLSNYSRELSKISVAPVFCDGNVGEITWEVGVGDIREADIVALIASGVIAGDVFGGASVIACGDLICNSDSNLENSNNCAIDCGSGYLDYAFNQGIKFFECRFYTSLVDPPLPEGLVEFTVAREYGGIPAYAYNSIAEVDGNSRISKDHAYFDYKVVSLTDSEIDELFALFHESDYPSLIRFDKIQRADIQKFYCENYLHLCSGSLTEDYMPYGILTDENWTPLYDEDGEAIPDSIATDYWDGSTIVYPVYRGYSNDRDGRRLIFNYKNPVVREYLVNQTLQVISSYNDYERFFYDNFGISIRLLKRGGDGIDLNWVSSGDIQNQTEEHADLTMEIIHETYRRANVLSGHEMDIIVNGFRDWSDHNRWFQDRVRVHQYFGDIGGMMTENRYWMDDPWSTNVQFYIDWIQALKANGQKVLFTAWADNEDFHSNSSFIYNLWLWNHLVGDDNTYFYINDYEYMRPMLDYHVYDYPLGEPLEDPHNITDTWYREYGRGTIVFNTSSGKLDEIKFIENIPLS